MDREKIYKEIEETIGVVPGMFKKIPDTTLEEEWRLFRKMEIEEGPIPLKYRELMGLAQNSATKCKYCTYFHTEMAKALGATDEEIEFTLHYAKHASGWSTYVNGLQIDFDEFRKDVQKACDHAHSVLAH